MRATKPHFINLLYVALHYNKRSFGDLEDSTSTVPPEYMYHLLLSRALSEVPYMYVVYIFSLLCEWRSTSYTMVTDLSLWTMSKIDEEACPSR